MKYVKHQPVSLKTHPQLNEKWLQDRIVKDTGLLGLGELDVRQAERRQTHSQRLDLLLEDSETDTRYEVELQLGRTDESHIIRTIEYWDNERRRFPQYNHVAVIVAEEITARFFNVISLFNGFIPIIAIQVSAIVIQEHVMTLVFTKVLDRMTLGTEAEDQGEPTDRAFWEDSSTPKVLELSDRVYEYIREIDPLAAQNYTKFYIGLSRNSIATNYIVRRLYKQFLRLEMKLPESEERTRALEESGIKSIKYDTREKCYRMNLTDQDLQDDDRRVLVLQWIKDAYDHRSGDAV